MVLVLGTTGYVHISLWKPCRALDERGGKRSFQDAIQHKNPTRLYRFTYKVKPIPTPPKLHFKTPETPSIKALMAARSQVLHIPPPSHPFA